MDENKNIPAAPESAPQNGSASPATWEEAKSEMKQAVREGVSEEKADFKKNPLWYIVRCIIVVAVVAFIFTRCSGTTKHQILETAKTFTLGDNQVSLGEAAETNLTNVEWTCGKVDDGYWTVTLSGYNPNEDSNVTLLMEITEISDTQVSYVVTYAEINGMGSYENCDINYAIALVYDNVGQALVDSLTSYLLGL